MCTELILSLSRNSILYGISITTVWITVAVMIIRSYLLHKMVFYLKKHPDKIKDADRHWWADFKTVKLLEKEFDITDPNFSRLLKNIRRITILSQLILFLIILLLFVIILFRT